MQAVHNIIDVKIMSGVEPILPEKSTYIWLEIVSEHFWPTPTHALKELDKVVTIWFDLDV